MTIGCGISSSGSSGGGVVEKQEYVYTSTIQNVITISQIINPPITYST
jgi:hypothetical protein